MRCIGWEHFSSKNIVKILLLSDIPGNINKSSFIFFFTAQYVLGGLFIVINKVREMNMFEGNFGNFKIVFTQKIGEHIYKEVLDDFDNAKYIYISSYGITTNTNFDNRLFKKINDLKNPNVIKVITNIRTKNELNDLEKLLKSKLNSKLKIYFNLLNHSKIILTDKIAYVGSENFTEFSGSGTNVESGIITTDKKALEFLKKRLDSIIEYSYPTLDFARYKKRSMLVSRLEEKLKELENYTLDFKYLFEGETQIVSSFSDTIEYDLSVTNIDDIIDWRTKAKSTLNEIKGLLKHELRQNEPLNEIDSNLLSLKQNPKSKLITKTKNNAIAEIKFEELYEDILSNINDLEFLNFQSIDEKYNELYEKTINPENHIEEYDYMKNSQYDYDERDYPLSQQPNYKKQVAEVTELLDEEFYNVKNLHERYVNQIIDVEDSLLEARDKLSNLISVLRGNI